MAAGIAWPAVAVTATGSGGRRPDINLL
ncbi:hypothetical protein FMEAI12_1660003 [Parafrankia sp. Ea1.12]|nr:hypothetical protein FMEAI12_1660003 [Parafrankia sp. Ea1.12]